MIYIKTITEDETGIGEFAISNFPDSISYKKSDCGLTVRIRLGDKFIIRRLDDSVDITLKTKQQIFNALLILICNEKAGDFTFERNSPFSTVSFMLDCSRCAVINYESYCNLVVILAKLGYNQIELYTEDTYEISDEPYFGHLRGRFSKSELKKMDCFAKQYGIELVPCIQTLSHLDNLFLWPRFEKLQDIWDCLLIDNEETYALIDKMFATCAECFTSKKIHIGYDEAYHAGRGKYLDKNGYKDKFSLLHGHLIRILSIAEKYGFSCKMYGDMFIRQKQPKDVAMPENVEYIYWDYYNTHKNHYDSNFRQYKNKFNNISFASGAWKWLGITPFNNFGIKRIKAGLTSARQARINSVMLSAWGDNGSECSVFAVIPQIVYFAAMCITDDPSSSFLNSLTTALTGISYRTWLKLDMANGHKNKYYSIMTNPAKYLLYNDPLCGIMDYHVDGNYVEYYKACSKKYTGLIKRCGKWSYLFEEQKALFDYLSVKANMGNELQKLYRSGNKTALSDYANKVVPRAIARLDDFIDVFRRTWYTENKTFGFDVIELRLGGQRLRLQEIIKRVNEYINGDIAAIEELDQEKLPCNYPNEKGLVYKHNSKYIMSPFFPVV